MVQHVETTTILNAQTFWMPFAMSTLWEHQQTDKQNGRTDRQTDRRYQTYYLPCFAVDNEYKGSAFRILDEP